MGSAENSNIVQMIADDLEIQMRAKSILNSKLPAVRDALETSTDARKGKKSPESAFMDPVSGLEMSTDSVFEILVEEIILDLIVNLIHR